MHAMRLLERWLQRNAVIGHQARVGALVRVVGALLSGGRLAVSHLGRHRAGRAFVKHHIKAVTDCWAILTCIGNETVSVARWRGPYWEASRVR